MVFLPPLVTVITFAPVVLPIFTLIRYVGPYARQDLIKYRHEDDTVLADGDGHVPQTDDKRDHHHDSHEHGHGHEHGLVSLLGSDHAE